MGIYGIHPAIGVASWCFAMKLHQEQMEFSHFFAAIRALGVRKAELNSFFFRSQDDDYVDEVQASAHLFGVAIVNVAVDDMEFDLSSPDEEHRAEAVARTIRWIEIAERLGSTFVRNNSGGIDAAATTKSYTELAVAARKHGRRVVIEAHGGFSNDAAQIIPIVEAVREAEPGGLSLIPDFGNVAVTPERDRYAQIEAMAPYAALCHPKMHDFDARGDQLEWNMRRLVSIVARSGFRGPWIIEYEGKLDDEFEGLRKSLVLLTRCLRDVA